MVVFEESAAILEEIPHDENIHAENDQDGEEAAVGLGPVDQFEDVNGNEERRFADGEPPGPGDAEQEADAFHEGEQAVKKSPAGQPDHFGFGNGRDLVGQVGEEFLFRVEMQKIQGLAERVGQVFV